MSGGTLNDYPNSVLNMSLIIWFIKRRDDLLKKQALVI